MATNLLPMNAVTIRAAAGNTRITDNNRRKTSVGGGKWWTPLFGWSSDADYIDNNNNNNNNNNVKEDGEVRSEKTPASFPAKTTAAKFTPGCFTEEKAKELRMRTKESFHDVMYHSAIASRLASDFSKRDGGE